MKGDTAEGGWTPPQVETRADRMRRPGSVRSLETIRSLLLPFVAGVLLLMLWQSRVIHGVLNLRTYQLPLPSTIAQAIHENAALLLAYAGYTLSEAVLGLMVGSTLGLIIAVCATFWPRWGSGGVWLVAALNAIPIVALAPIMNLWFGDGMGSRIAIVSVTTMAAMAVGAYKGLTAVDPLAMDFMQANAASRWQIFRHVRIYNSLPYVLTALKVNTTAAMIGAIVGEFFYSSKGLGYLLSNSIKVAKMPLGWACIVVAALAGIVFYLLADGLERVLLRWHTSQRT